MTISDKDDSVFWRKFILISAPFMMIHATDKMCFFIDRHTAMLPWVMRITQYSEKADFSEKQFQCVILGI